jgi:L-2-hydroxyglutarate oxidase LhgO
VHDLPATDVAIVGGGILGLATALQLGRLRPDLRITVLEKERELATHQSGRNSNVVHAGIYYAPGSQKALLCRSGKAELEAFCTEHDIPVRRIGKLVVARDAGELPALARIRERALANGVADVEEIESDRLREMEPDIAGLRGLWSPGTGITDFRRVALAFAEVLRVAGASILTATEVRSLAVRPEHLVVGTSNGDLRARSLISCAGLWADRVSAMSGTGGRNVTAIVPFRGDYYDLTPSAAARVRSLVYPVPDPRFPFLGVHFTPQLDGSVRAGPNAVLALAREGYRRRDVSVRDLAGVVRFPGFVRLAARHWRTGAAEMWRDVSRHAFASALREYMPALRDDELVWGRSGVRAQALRRDGSLVDDFEFGGGGRVLHVRNAPSPAATASLAIGRRIANQAVQQFGV